MRGGAVRGCALARVAEERLELVAALDLRGHRGERPPPTARLWDQRVPEDSAPPVAGLTRTSLPPRSTPAPSRRPRRHAVARGESRGLETEKRAFFGHGLIVIPYLNSFLDAPRAAIGALGAADHHGALLGCWRRGSNLRPLAARRLRSVARRRGCRARADAAGRPLAITDHAGPLRRRRARRSRCRRSRRCPLSPLYSATPRVRPLAEPVCAPRVSHSSPSPKK